MIFEIYYISVDFLYLPLNSLPSATTRSEHYLQSNVWPLKMQFPLLWDSLLLCKTHTATFWKTKNEMLPKLMSPPFSQDGGNQNHLKHKNRGSLIPNIHRFLALWMKINTVQQKNNERLKLWNYCLYLDPTWKLIRKRYF